MDAYEHRAISLAERAPGPKMNYFELIQNQAEQIFGNKEKADTWLNHPKAFLSGKTPMQTAPTEAGYELIKAELEKLSHGFAC